MSDPIKFGISCSNYFDFNKGAESLNLLTTSLNKEKMTFSLGLGADTAYKLNSGKQESVTNIAFEAKAKYGINDNLNAQARFRKIGDAEQYRLTFGGSYKFDSKNSIYSSAHITTKHSSGDWTSNIGAWVGCTHNFDKISVSAELQQNIPFDRELKSKDTMFNLITTIHF